MSRPLTRYRPLIGRPPLVIDLPPETLPRGIVQKPLTRYQPLVGRPAFSSQPGVAESPIAPKAGAGAAGSCTLLVTKALTVSAGAGAAASIIPLVPDLLIAEAGAGAAAFAEIDTPGVDLIPQASAGAAGSCELHLTRNLTLSAGVQGAALAELISQGPAGVRQIFRPLMAYQPMISNVPPVALPPVLVRAEAGASAAAFCQLTVIVIEVPPSTVDITLIFDDPDVTFTFDDPDITFIFG